MHPRVHHCWQHGSASCHLAHAQGRTDDNLETIKKRFHVFMSQSMPVVEEYEKCSKVGKHCAVAGRLPPARVYAPARVCALYKLFSACTDSAHLPQPCCCLQVARINTDRPVDVIYKEVRRLVMEV